MRQNPYPWFQGVLSTGRSVDRDNNGQLSLGEAKEALTSGTVTVNDRRVSNGKLTGKLDAEWPKLMRSFDKNNDDEISLDEVKDAVKDVVEEAIRTVDTDRDEKMSLEELKNIVDPDTLPHTVMKIIDEDGDGQFSYAEFKKEAENRWAIHFPFFEALLVVYTRVLFMNPFGALFRPFLNPFEIPPIGTRTGYTG